MKTPQTKQDLLDLISGEPETAEAFDKGMYAQQAARLITEMREAAELSKTQLANRLGVSVPRIAEAENPKGSDGPTYRFLSRVATVCGFVWPTSVSELKRQIPGEVELATPTTGREYFLVEVEPLPGDTFKTPQTRGQLDEFMRHSYDRIRLVGLATVSPDGTVVVPALVANRLRAETGILSVLHRFEDAAEGTETEPSDQSDDLATESGGTLKES